MKTDRLKYFAAKLGEEKRRLLSQISQIEERGLGKTLRDSVHELSAYDNHPADLGDELFERSKDLALRDNAHVLLESVEKALDKIADGTYGRCERCGREIEHARLEAIPWATECVACKRKEEAPDPTPRPLEEDVLAPPFHRTFLDTAPFANVGYDGEDSWQDVAKYGSSDSPQDIPGSYDYKALWANSNEHQGIVDRTDYIPASPRTYGGTGENTAKDKTKEKRPGGKSRKP